MDPIGSGVRFGGLATGIDTASLIDALLTLERRPLDLIQQRRDGIAEQQSLLRDANTKLLALRDAARGLDNRNDFLSGDTLDEELLAYTASSSDETVVTATASGDASPGSLDLEVLNLASTGRRISTTFVSNSDLIAAQGDTLSIDYGGEDDIDITVGVGGASLADLRELINSHENNEGAVQAEVLFDGSDYRLVVSGVETGAANDLSVTSSITGGLGEPFIDATLDQVAADAQVEVLGVTISRPSNVLDDVLPGVSLTLHGVTGTDETVQVNIERDDEAIAGKIQGFADAYNEFRDFVKQQNLFDEEAGRAGPLARDVTLRGIDRQLQRLLGAEYGPEEDPFRTLGQLGLRFDREGRLDLDREVLTSALDQDPLAVRQLLRGDGSEEGDGVAVALARALDDITKIGRDPVEDGEPRTFHVMWERDQAFQTRLGNVDQQIERFEARLAKREESLVQTYSRLESLVSSLQAQSSFLLSAF